MPLGENSNSIIIQQTEDSQPLSEEQLDREFRNLPKRGRPEILPAGTFRQRSLNAEKVADDVIRTIAAGKHPNFTQLQIQNGFSPASAKSQAAMKTKSFQQRMARWERDTKDDLSKIVSLANEKIIAFLQNPAESPTVRDLAYVGDLSSKNLNLMTGKATQNVHTITETIVHTRDDANEYLKKLGVLK